MKFLSGTLLVLLFLGTQLPAQIQVKKYTWYHTPAVGTYNGTTIGLGGASGLTCASGKNDGFYTITDRGPNLDAGKNSHLIGNKDAANAKVFPLPSFTPEIMHWKLQGDSIVLLDVIPLKKPDLSPASGIINPPQQGGTGELALMDTLGTQASPDPWGTDPEGICEGGHNDFWICEEYGTSIWHVNKTSGALINRFTPFPVDPKIDVKIDDAFKYRNPNKGFEGIAFAPNGKVYAFLQNPMHFPVNDPSVKKNSRLHRFVELDPSTNTTRMLGYEHDVVPASGPLSSIKNEKRYIGDAA
ncbi:MAG TPA: esterase-like activity of phytase family protein, partial [Bacteroidia bacterium]|nr:esterase-like activity of phytase family protein [Bacteroidia bacterium]